jgi:hypothetical protein
VTGGSHAQNFQPREAPARSIRALGEGAGTGLPTILLSSKIDRRCLGRAGASAFSPPATKSYRAAIRDAGGDALKAGSTHVNENAGIEGTQADLMCH